MKKRITACAAALVTAAAFGDVAWTNDLAILTFGWSGAVKSLVERETGRELVKPGSFVFVSVGDRLVYPSKFENPGGDLYLTSGERSMLGLNGSYIGTIRPQIGGPYA